MWVWGRGAEEMWEPSWTLLWNVKIYRKIYPWAPWCQLRNQLSKSGDNLEWVGCVFMKLETTELCLLGWLLCLCCHTNYLGNILCSVYWTVCVFHGFFGHLLWRQPFPFYTEICKFLSTWVSFFLQNVCLESEKYQFPPFNTNPTKHSGELL